MTLVLMFMHDLNSPSGTYTIRTPGGSPMTVYCNMANAECGGGVWTGVAQYDFSDSSTTCPGNWYQITSPIRACGRASGIGCVSASFFTSSIQFNRVCGRVIAVQYGDTQAFSASHKHYNLRNIE